jgi:hypothetical protein
MPSLLLFAWRKALTQSGLPAATRHVALALSTYMDSNGNGARPSIDRIAHDVGRHVDTVRRHLRHLEQTGWLAVEATKGGRHHTNRWHAQIPNRSYPQHPPVNPRADAGVSFNGTLNPRASVGKPPRPRGGISYDLPYYKVENNYLVVPREAVEHSHRFQTGTHTPRAPPRKAAA